MQIVKMGRKIRIAKKLKVNSGIMQQKRVSLRELIFVYVCVTHHVGRVNHQAMCVCSNQGNNHLQSPHCFCLAQESRRCCHWQQILLDAEVWQRRLLQ